MEGNLKKALFELMDSHSKLAQAEYERDDSYNDSHFSAKAEQSIIDYLNQNDPDAFTEYLDPKRTKTK